MANKAEISKYLADNGIAIVAKFIPLSQSRNATPRKNTATGKMEVWQSLNYTVTLFIGGRNVLETDYAMGSGHAPANKRKDSYLKRELIAWECEHGLAGYVTESSGHIIRARLNKNLIMPDAADVIYSLVSDSDVLDHGTFEDWAESLGYDTDSRTAESIYRACLEIALKLRNGLGEERLAKLRELYQDY